MRRRTLLATLAGTTVGCLDTGSESATERDRRRSATDEPTDTRTPGVGGTESPTTTATETEVETETETTGVPAELPPVSGEWRQPLADGGHTGVVPTGGLASDGDDGDGRGSGNAGDGGDDGDVHPAVYWRRSFERRVAQPVFADGTAYVGVEDGLVALAARDGRRQWQVSLRNRGPCVPAVASDGTVVVRGHSAVSAHDRSDGRQLWRVSPEPGAVVGLALAGEAVYVTTATTVAAYDLDGGERLWRQSITVGGSLDRPAVVDGRVFVADDASAGRLRAYDAADGRRLWRVSAAVSHPTPIVARDGTVAVGGFYGSVVAHDVSDGSQRWRGNAGPPVGRLLVDADGAYAYGEGGSDYTLARLAAATGDRVWTHERAYPLAAGDGRLYAATGDATVALDANNGRELWRVPVDGSRAMVADGALFLATDQSVVAVGPRR